MPVQTMYDLEFISGLKSAYSKLNYYEFCKVLGLRDDDYAMDLWTKWTTGITALFRLSDTALLTLAGEGINRNASQVRT